MISLVSVLDNAWRLFEFQFLVKHQSEEKKHISAMMMLMKLHHWHCSVSTMNAIKLFSEIGIDDDDETFYVSLVFPCVLQIYKFFGLMRAEFFVVLMWCDAMEEDMEPIRWVYRVLGEKERHQTRERENWKFNKNFSSEWDNQRSFISANDVIEN